MRKILFTMMVVAILACSAMASLRQHQVFIVDEYGKAVTNITSITIFNSGLGTSPTIYSDRGGNLTMTNPITTASTNSTFVQSLGQVRWFQAKPTYKITITDGTKSLTLDSRAEGDTRFAWFANYIGSLSSFNLSDTDNLNFGTDTDVVGTWENANDILSWIPAVDGVSFDIGDSGTTANMNFNIYVGTALGLKIDEGVPSFTWDGGAASINASSNFATNINTGTSTGAVSIGSSTAGIITIDTTTTLTMNSDGAMSLTTTDGSADLLVDATVGSIIIDGGEAVADAVIIRATGAAGGIDIISLADIDITTTGTAGEDISLINTGGSIVLSATESVVDAIKIDATLGGLQLLASGAAAGEDILITATGSSIVATATEAIADAIVLNASAGGVDISSAATFDIDITATGGRVLIVASEAVADQFKVDATGTVAGNAINFETTDGGILLNADGGTNGDITIDAASVISLTAGDAAGIVTNVATFEHKGIFYNFSAGIVSASEMIVEPGQGLLCVGLTAGAAEIGSTEGFVGSDTETDFIRFMITMPDDWVDTGTQADVILTFDIDEQAAEECNIDFRMFEYDGAANTSAIITDTIVAADDGTRAFKSLVTNSAGIGNEADLKPGSVYIIELTGNAAADDFDIYGMKMVYRVGLQPSE